MSSDKLEQHYGLQLSALMDGELAPDQARFLLRRLQHDGELAGSWERWQLAGDVLRGRAEVLLPEDFAARVGAALRADAPATDTRRTPGLLRWGGVAALAASVAVVALMVPRQMPGTRAPGDAPQVAATSPSGMQPVFVLPPRVAEPAEIVQPPVAAPVRVLASRDASARAIDRDRSRTPVSAAASALSPDRTADVVAATTSPSPDEAVRDPFSDAVLVQRPWPRAVLPQFGNGALATGLPAGDSLRQPPRQPSFYPFEPRLPGAGESGQGAEQGAEQSEQPEPDLPPQAPY